MRKKELLSIKLVGIIGIKGKHISKKCDNSLKKRLKYYKKM